MRLTRGRLWSGSGSTRRPCETNVLSRRSPPMQRNRERKKQKSKQKQKGYQIVYIEHVFYKMVMVMVAASIVNICREIRYDMIW